MSLQRDIKCHYLEAGVVDSFQSWTGEYSMCENGVNFGGSRFQQLVSSHDDGAAGVRHVVHEDGHSVLGEKPRVRS